MFVKNRSILPFVFVFVPLLITSTFLIFQKKEHSDYFFSLVKMAQEQRDAEISVRLPQTDVEKNNERELVADVSTQAQKIGVGSERRNESSVPKQALLDVPFTPQAPRGDWSLPYQEACEEASIIMSMHYMNNAGKFTESSATAEILKLIQYEEKNGYAIDIPAEKAVELINAIFAETVTAHVETDVTVDVIKKQIAENNLVIMPFAGRKLGNKHFRSPGPLYHMLVITGYNEQEFITNDPGTRFGESFKYSYETILQANHDWNNGNVDDGQKIMIVVEKK